MTLTLRTEELRRRIENVIRLGKSHKEAEFVRARVSELKTTHDEFEGTLAKLSVLTKQAGALLKMPDASTALTNLADYAAKLRDESTTDSGKDYQRFRRSLSKVVGDLGKTLETALGAIEKDAPSIDETFLKQVELIPSHVAQVQEIRRERDALLSGRDLRAMDAAQLSNFLKKREVVRSLADRLDVKEFPKEVLDFFAAARPPRGAPIEKLTETVRKWLEDRDQLKNVRITVVSR